MRNVYPTGSFTARFIYGDDYQPFQLRNVNYGPITDDNGVTFHLGNKAALVHSIETEFVTGYEPTWYGIKRKGYCDSQITFDLFEPFELAACLYPGAWEPYDEPKNNIISDVFSRALKDIEQLKKTVTKLTNKKGKNK